MEVHNIIVDKLLELFKARNLDVNNEHLELIETLKRGDQENPSALFDFDDQTYYISFHRKITKDQISQLEEQLNTPNHTIILISDEVTSMGKDIYLRTLQNIRSNKTNFELWRPYQLRINPLTHSLAPEYKIMTEEEKLNELPSLKTNPNLIKELLRFHDDPVVKWLGAKVGDIIKIKRISNIIGSITDYRVVKKIQLV